MNILNKYYQYSLGPDILAIVEKLNLKLDFVIEAGCHDGTDTERFLKHLKGAKIYAFEPDSKARLKAEKKLIRFIPKQISISPYALSNCRGEAFLVFEGVSTDGTQAGSGATRIAKKGKKAVQTRMLDEMLPNQLRRGLLWLDVEGHAVQALSGATKTLRKIIIAKIEIQMHDMGPGRNADLFSVLQIMKRSGLIPIYGPLHPGYFGDVIFIQSHKSGLKLKIKSFLIKIQFRILHKIIYPALNKPKKQLYKVHKL